MSPLREDVRGNRMGYSRVVISTARDPFGHPQVRETKIGPRGVAPRSNSVELAGGLRPLAVRYSAVTCPRLVFGDVGACDRLLLHGYRQATLDDLAILRVAFEDGTPLGWEAVHAFEEQQGIVLPEPYRTCVAEITDGAAGPRTTSWSSCKIARAERWAWPERDLTKPFPLSEAWIWETTSVRMRSSARCWMPSTITARSYLAPTPAQCTGT